MARHRISLHESIRGAWRADKTVSDPDGFGFVVVALWYWIVGVPDNEPPGSG